MVTVITASIYRPSISKEPKALNRHVFFCLLRQSQSRRGEKKRRRRKGKEAGGRESRGRGGGREGWAVPRGTPPGAEGPE